MLRRVAEDALFEIGPSAMRVFDRAREGIHVDRVESEVAPSRRLFERYSLVVLDFKVAVPGSRPRLAPREGDIDRVAVELEHAKRRADEIETVAPGEKFLEFRGRYRIDLHVEVAGRLAEKDVPYAPAYEIRSSARGGSHPRDFAGLFQLRGRHTARGP